MLKWLTSAIIVAIVATGCSTAARNETSPSPQNNGRMQAQNVPRAMDYNNSEEVAAHLEQLARRIEGVTDAHCVVLGNTAVVGINVDAKMERSRVGTIKYSVAEAFQKDPYGINAVVTADIDLAQRLNEIGDDIRRGRPAAGFAEEMADIMGRIVPQVPRDVKPQEIETQEAPRINNR